MRDNEYAVSVVVSAMLALMLVSSVSGTILLWGIPLTDRIKGEAVLESVFNQLSIASELTRDMIQESAGSARQYNLLVQGGQVHINSTGDRLIVMFSLKPGVNFYVTGLDDNDEKIEIWEKGQIVNARAYWFITEPSETLPGTPKVDEEIAYTTVNFDLVPLGLPGETYKYKLSGYNDDFTSYTNKSNITYFDLPDHDNYKFEAREKGGESFSRSFSVIEGLDVDRAVKHLGPPPARFAFKFDLVGTVRIDLMESGGGLLGRVYIFDLGFVECKIQNTAGVFRKIWENNGILSIDSNENFVNREPMISSQDDMFALRVMQLRSLESKVVGGTFVEAKLGVYLVENYIREMLTEAYDMKIQVYGSYSDTWLEYLKNIHGFTDHFIEANTLEHPAGIGNQIDLLLSQSLCNAYI